MATETTDPMTGRLVDGRYEVVSRIARGGMATVYLALDKRLDRQVALKIMHAHLAEGPGGAQFIARFRREARAAARLTHPAIVAVYDQGTDGDLSYLAMEYVPGSTLRHVLHEEGPFTLRRTLGVIESVCDALAAAHRAGLVHRDVKPENILIDSENRPRITDFGLARAVDEITATTTGTVMGTVAYLAPELISTGTSDARSDLYAVGIMAHEMITGAAPHAGTTPIQVAFQHVNVDVPPPSGSVPGLPPAIDTLVCTLTARDPDRRPADAASALDLVRSTRAALSAAELDQTTASTALPVGAAPASATAVFGAVPVPGRTTEDSGHDPGATALIDFRPGTTPGPAPQAHPEPTVPSSPPPETSPTDDAPRRRLPWIIATVVFLLAAVGGGLWWMLLGPGAYTQVPDGVVGAAQSAAETVLEDAGLEHTNESKYHDTVPEGTVVSADPTSGDKIPKDGTVHLVVSRGILMVEIPSGLVGMESAKATAALTEVGFTVTDPANEFSDTEPAGQVLAVSGPDGALTDGVPLPHSTPITLTVSGGPAPIVVEDVVGKTEADAVGALKNQGLSVDSSREDSESVEEGKVIRQEPAAGTDAHRTDPATIVVSNGPPMVEVPNVYGRNVRDAQDLLEAAGFTVKVEYPQTLHPLNMVYSQSPEGGNGKKAQKGSTITLNVF